MVVEIAASPLDLREYLADAARTLLEEARVLDVLPGFVLDDEQGPLHLLQTAEKRSHRLHKSDADDVSTNALQRSDSHHIDATRAP